MSDTSTSEPSSPASAPASPEAIQPIPLATRLLAEFVVTFALIFGVLGAALVSTSGGGIVGIALAGGFIVAASIYAAGWISGSVMNPALAVGLAVSGHLPWRWVVPYAAAQLAGGVAASSLLFFIVHDSPEATAVAGATNFASNGYGDHSLGGFGLLAAIITEILATAILMFVVLGTTDRRAPSGGVPIAVGVTVTTLLFVPCRSRELRLTLRALSQPRSTADRLPSVNSGCSSSSQSLVPSPAALLYRPLFDRNL